MKQKLVHPVDSVSEKRADYQEHGTEIRHLLSQRSMRCVGRAIDLGIVRER